MAKRHKHKGGSKKLKVHGAHLGAKAKHAMHGKHGGKKRSRRKRA